MNRTLHTMKCTTIWGSGGRHIQTSFYCNYNQCHSAEDLNKPLDYHCHIKLTLNTFE